MSNCNTLIFTLHSCHTTTPPLAPPHSPASSPSRQRALNGPLMTPCKQRVTGDKLLKHFPSPQTLRSPFTHHPLLPLQVTVKSSASSGSLSFAPLAPLFVTLRNVKVSRPCSDPKPPRRPSVVESKGLVGCSGCVRACVCGGWGGGQHIS